MFRFFKFRRSSTSPSTDVSAAQVGPSPTQPLGPDNDEESPHYPPSDRGIPVEPLERVLVKQKDLIDRIRRASGVTPEIFVQHYEPPIRNLAAHVHLLPATDNEFFVGPGGLLRMSLEVALHSLQAAHGSIFPSVGSVDKRSAMLPRWELASFLAGLCSQIYRPITNLVVTDRHNNQWPQLLYPLYDWAQTQSANKYFVRWAPGGGAADRQGCSAFLTNRIIPVEVLQYLDQDNKLVLPAMTAAISGSDLNPSENPISKLVAPITTRVIHEDNIRSSRHYGRYSLGIHLEPHLLDAMRRLIKSGKWTINTKGARVWVGQDGVFVIWGAGVKEIIGLLTADSFVGLPQDPDTLADILIECAVFDRDAGSRYWTITLPDSGTVIDNAVKLVVDGLIFPPKYDLDPLRTLTLSTSTTPAAPVTPAPGNTGGERSAATQKPKRKSAKGTPDAAPTATKVKHEPEESQITSTGPNLELFKEPKAARPPGEQNDAVHGAAQTPPGVEAEPQASEVPASSTDSVTPDDDLVPVSEKLLDHLGRESRWLIGQILKAANAGKLTGAVENLPQGLGISDAEIGAHGLAPDGFINDFATLNWLWVDKNRPLKKIHRIQVKDTASNFLIIQPQVARGLGFDWRPPVSEE